MEERNNSFLKVKSKLLEKPVEKTYRRNREWSKEVQVEVPESWFSELDKVSTSRSH